MTRQARRQLSPGARRSWPLFVKHKNLTLVPCLLLLFSQAACAQVAARCCGWLVAWAAGRLLLRRAGGRAAAGAADAQTARPALLMVLVTGSQHLYDSLRKHGQANRLLKKQAADAGQPHAPAVCSISYLAPCPPPNKKRKRSEGFDPICEGPQVATLHDLHSTRMSYSFEAALTKRLKALEGCRRSHESQAPT
jgi:hypothetical protein